MSPMGSTIDREGVFEYCSFLFYTLFPFLRPVRYLDEGDDTEIMSLQPARRTGMESQRCINFKVVRVPARRAQYPRSPFQEPLSPVEFRNVNYNPTIQSLIDHDFVLVDDMPPSLPKPIRDTHFTPIPVQERKESKITL